MKLDKIDISNYRSIEKLELEIKVVNGSQTFALLGINESGKSSFLQAMSLVESGQINHPLDYFNQKEEVYVQLSYSLTKEDKETFHEHLIEEKGFPEELAKKIDVTKVYVVVDYAPDSAQTKRKYQSIELKTKTFSDYTQTPEGIVTKTEDSQEVFNFEQYVEDSLSEYFLDLSHKVVFWKSSPQYLILDEIDLPTFATNPEQTSIPLVNCFRLAGIEIDEIKSTIDGLTSSVPINNLQEKLSELVTEHINKVWPEHPIKVKFQISSNKISLLIEDEGVKFKVKTTGQRSDGFRQFVSFLLTLSVKNYNGELENTILLIDEPEVHLHPPAQINLLSELIEITSNKRNNIVFFATHSNYLIDKTNLDRCYQVIKEDNHKTILNKIEKTTSTYAEVNYEVFKIPTTDYHNELYGYLEDVEKAKLNALEKDRKWKNASKGGAEEDVSLSRYIRHSIHHPENYLNRMYTEKQLIKSIEILRKLKYE
ncbi:ATP-dependent nuclease [Zhouia amylolytica]|uniref:ATP-dependent nuclease n=1 Tax=Zhouia amylolytica TaxID=376730 RepID=UPI0020CEC7DD|nr:AAA family ATPase [Zhouia amylolytica]MCQ0111213.1 AAA family ATPase [Zhouia amylolytica]